MDKKQEFCKYFTWSYLIFSENYGLFSKVINFVKIYFLVFIVLIKNKNIDIVHARGLMPNSVAIFYKFFFGYKLIFDSRGFWAEERLDNGNWNLNNFIGKFLYNYFSYVEKKSFIQSEKVIFLTHKARERVILKYRINPNKTYVLPCVADYNKFKILNDVEKVSILKSLNIDNSNFLFLYIGSINKIYNPELMIDFFKNFNKFKTAQILFITFDKKKLKKFLKKKLNRSLLSKVILLNSNEIDIYKILSICDYSLSFIYPSIARIASSPTKIGESLASGVPMITIKGVGDSDSILNKMKYNVLLNSKKNNYFNIFPKLRKFNFEEKKYIRLNSKKYYDLELAIIILKSIYHNLKS